MGIGDTVRCSACGARPTDERSLVHTPGPSLCADCIRVCWDIVQDRQRSIGLGLLPPDRALARRLREGLPAQVQAAATLAHLAEDLLAGRPVPASTLLVGPSGSGKSHALRLLGCGLDPSRMLTLDGDRATAREQLESCVRTPGRHPVIVVDDLGRLLADRHSLAALRALLAQGDEQCVPIGERTLLVAGLTAAPVASKRRRLAAHSAGQSATVDGEPAALLPAALEAGVPADVLARFALVVPFRALDAGGLRCVLEQWEEGGLADGAHAAQISLRIGPSAREDLVADAVRVGGGAWGLRAVLNATLSGLEAASEDVAPSRTPSRTEPPRSAHSSPRSVAHS